ncbi:MAG: AbrB/MazE/SpoVT family DNA-binding domain-containing protein [Candidatus Omnitrophota bacterium]|nr:AbrB/MazE/SpoVT family DNA-binding domain-containing protein [Candidatus Omnitrophota bacterium]
MRLEIVPIGNSKGIRIPKTVLEQCHIKKSIDMEVKSNSIILKPFKKEPRKNWGQAFRKMHENRDDALLIDDRIDLDMKRWEWK